jgi:hypothetical protein
MMASAAVAYIVMGKKGVKEEERGQCTAVPHISDDMPTANQSNRDVARGSSPLSRLAPRATRSV